MNLIVLGEKLKKDPITYAKEFEEELNALESLINLPTIPEKELKPLVAFVIKNAHVNRKRSLELLLYTLSKIKDLKVRRSVLGGMILFRQKGIIESSELFRAILMYGSDLKFYFKACQEYVDPGCYDVLKEWFYKGLEKQKAFCYYFILILFSNNDVEGKNSISKNSIRSGDEISKDEISKTSKSKDEISKNSISKNEISKNSISSDILKYQSDEMESIICEGFFGVSKLSKICILYFLNRTELSFNISKIRNGYEYGKKIYFELLENIMERDIKIKKAQIYVLFKKEFAIKNSVTNILLKMIDLEKEDLHDIFDCLIQSVEKSEVFAVLKLISEEFVNEKKDDDIVCYGLNVIRELYSKFLKIKNEEENSAIDDHFLSELKDCVLGYISIFSGNHTKSIHYAYKSLIKTVVHGEIVQREITFILKSKNKEDREKLRIKNREERNKEIAKEQREKKLKRNRKGKIKKRKNKLNIVSKKVKR